MHGNVWGFCLDWYAAYAGAQVEPVGTGSGTLRVFRGGAWSETARGCRSARRAIDSASNSHAAYGIRLCLPMLP